MGGKRGFLHPGLAWSGRSTNSSPWGVRRFLRKISMLGGWTLDLWHKNRKNAFSMAKTTRKSIEYKVYTWKAVWIYTPTWSEKFFTSNWINWKSTLYKTQYYFALELKRTGSLGQRGFRSLGLKFFGHVHWDRDKTHGTGCCCWCFWILKGPKAVVVEVSHVLFWFWHIIIHTPRGPYLS